MYICQEIGQSWYGWGALLRIQRFVLLFAFSGFFLACSSPPDPLLLSWEWRATFNFTPPGASPVILHIHRSFTNCSGERLLRTEIRWEESRKNSVVSYMAKDVKYTILDDAGHTIRSNHFVFLETEQGEPKAVTARVRGSVRSTRAYRALIRKRLDELFVKHFGAAASGRARFVDEQLASTWKGELASLPVLDLRWCFSDKGWDLRGRDHTAPVKDTGRVDRPLLLPAALTREISEMGRRGGGRMDAALILPWYSREPVNASLRVSPLSNGFICSFSSTTNDAPFARVSICTGMRPLAVQAGQVGVTLATNGR